MTFKYKNLRNYLIGTMGASVLMQNYGNYFNHNLPFSAPGLVTVAIGGTMIGKVVLDYKNLCSPKENNSVLTEEVTGERFKEGFKNVIYSFCLPFAIGLSKDVVKVGDFLKSPGVTNFVNKTIETLNSNSFVTLSRGVDDILLGTGLGMIAFGAMGHILKESKR
ncbi:MAG: hypothetical protein QXD23_03785 [Candidatus Micrarchaeaceae archaeon]